MITDINSEDRLVQQTFADHLRDGLGWESVYAYNAETFGSQGTLGRASEREVVLVRDLRAALARLNRDLRAQKWLPSAPLRRPKTTTLSLWGNL